MAEEEKGERIELYGQIGAEEKDGFVVCFRLKGEGVEAPDRIKVGGVSSLPIDKSAIITAIDKAGIEGVKAYGGLDRTFCIKISKGIDYDAAIREVLRIASEEIKRQIDRYKDSQRRSLEDALQKYRAEI